MGQDNSCHPYIISHNCDADSAYGSTTGSNCCEADIALYHLTTSDDSDDADESYDADDEIDGLTNECRKETSSCAYRKRADMTRPERSRSRPDSGMFFCFSQTDRQDSQYSYLMNVIRERAKLSETIYKTDDEGKCRLFSVEYDVIGTEDDESGNGCRNQKSTIKPIITFRHHDLSDEGMVEIIASYKRRRLCKVKSLPDLRIPRRKKSTRCKESIYSESNDLYKDNSSNNNNSNNNNNSSNNNNNNNNNNSNNNINKNNLPLSLMNHQFSMDSDRFFPTKPLQNSSQKQHRKGAVKTCTYQVIGRKSLPTSRCVKLEQVSDRKLGSFQICHMIETLER